MAQTRRRRPLFVFRIFYKKISMDFKDVPLTDILKIFSKKSNLNFIASPDVADKKITLFLNGFLSIQR